jgi:hypothetical protein
MHLKSLTISNFRKFSCENNKVESVDAKSYGLYKDEKEFGTPLATAFFTGHEKDGFYGVETTPRRMLSDVLNARTPLPGLLLTGQDVMSPGFAGTLICGMFGAAAVNPRVFQKLK